MKQLVKRLFLCLCFTIALVAIVECSKGPSTLGQTIGGQIKELTK